MTGLPLALLIGFVLGLWVAHPSDSDDSCPHCKGPR